MIKGFSLRFLHIQVINVTELISLMELTEF